MNPQPTTEQLQQHIRLLGHQMGRIRQRLAAMDVSARLERAGRKPALPVEACSQWGEDVLLWDLFGGKTDGFFIEAGAFDGYTFSVTYLLESAGWKGLLVEAIPQRFEQCKARRPNSRVIHAALGRESANGTAEFRVLQDALGGMFSYVQGSSDPAQDRAVLNAPETRITVPLTTLNNLLSQHRGPIDVAVIDVEGSEPEVLEGLDLSRFRPRVLLIEDNTLGHNPRIDAALQNATYLQAGWIYANRVYIHRDEPELLLRFRAINTPW